ncbi:hypothetical protein EMIHUDRAFT_210090 [Emiliania huxleyi CCMP1516]|uniref:TIR domain-containing protein n=2 Tax=Emiliania huxleyi TaxID=2903 RepID=A0A0D3J1M0_EMIH1|nr:hypothetical protein EMIHUDRAFT_210090 [Emiliania huxleyi CCMP1516]EOD17405.1 hypothetical protein EMIHUDRAFT_210090 [Emiliania huxleyi CCMP1516]|eukprot:XP_005769834.1 hypothetical protein EMIHUDRAFT_210090 [Emiliania huxleyi CCMP1516]
MVLVFAAAEALLLAASGASSWLLGALAPRFGAASGQRFSKAAHPRTRWSCGAVALLLLLSSAPASSAPAARASGDCVSSLNYPSNYGTFENAVESDLFSDWRPRCAAPAWHAKPHHALTDELYKTDKPPAGAPQADELSIDVPSPFHVPFMSGQSSSAPGRSQQRGQLCAALFLLLVACGGLLREWMWPPGFGAASVRRSSSGRRKGAWLLLVALLPLAYIRDEINNATAENRNASVYIPPGVRLAFSSNVECSGEMHLSVRSSGEGATLDGNKSSNMFALSSGCSLYLEVLHFVDGLSGDYGGAVRASGAGDIAMKDVSFTGCEASGYGGAMYVWNSGDVSLEGASFSDSGDVSLKGASFSECTAGEYGGGMNVYNSGDVSLEGASFSECTAALVRLPRPHTLCYAVALAAVRPYKRVGDDVLAVATSLVLLLLFLGANWTTIFLGIEERHPDTAEAAATLGFGKLNGVQPPELSIVLGLTWHLFNSHIWSTGQDAVKVIKGELKQLLPDVDDLKDIGALEEYIQRSQVVLFFLSRGYFRSQARPSNAATAALWPHLPLPAPQNCLREVRSSLEMDKPLVLVQEADPEKGGGTLQALRDECPEDLQPAIFDKDWPLTIWYRSDEFQLISLKIIAEALRATASHSAVLSISRPTPFEQQAVLLCSPNYLNKTSLPLCVSGELESQSLAFSKQTTVWASPANPGAAELACELANAFRGLTVSTVADDDGERLAEHVKQAREDKLKIVMAHENDPDLGGCQFSRMFEVTPQERARGELIAGGLYKDLAKSCFPGRHRKARVLSHPFVSFVLLAKSLGATPARSRADLLSDSIVEGSTSLSKRSSGGLSRVFANMSSRSSAEARDVSGGEVSSVQRQV